MWCLKYCPCWKGSSLSEKETSGLLASPHRQSKDAEADKTQYYTVRRISSFGRTGSGDDVSDLENTVQSPAEFWTPKIQRVQPDVCDQQCAGDSTDTSLSPRPVDKPPPLRGRWKRALYPFRSPREKTEAWNEGGFIHPPPITVSSPNLQRDELEEDGASPSPSPCLQHAGTMTNKSSLAIISPQAKWLKSQSMQDINAATYKRDARTVLPVITQENDAAQIALSYGLDTSLYPPKIDCSPMSRSTEALNAWRSSPNADKLNIFQDQSCGTINFAASYYQKSKRLFIHINKIEGLPPKGDHYTYAILVKLTVLPLEKPVKVSKIVKDDLNPDIEEDFEFYVKDPLGKVLRLSVYDADHHGKYDAVGHALFYLEDVIAGRPRRYSMRLYKQSQPDVTPGTIHLTLGFRKETFVVTILVKDACNLLLSAGPNKSQRFTDKYNTYAKVVYFSAGQKMKSKKTSVVWNSRNPTYNQTFSFKLSANFLHDTIIVVSVMLKGKLKKDMPIGRLILGPFHYAEGKEITPWGRALVSNEEVSYWFRMYL